MLEVQNFCSLDQQSTRRKQEPQNNAWRRESEIIAGSGKQVSHCPRAWDWGKTKKGVSLIIPCTNNEIFSVHGDLILNSSLSCSLGLFTYLQKGIQLLSLAVFVYKI